MVKLILSNLLIYGLIACLTWSAAIFGLGKLKKRKFWGMMLGGNVLIILGIVFLSALLYESPRLEAEFSLCALQDLPNDSYSVNSLLEKSVDVPPKLGFKADSIGKAAIRWMQGLPVAYSGEKVQFRLKPNQKSFLYLYQFDSNSMIPNQLFPSDEIAISNPLTGESWHELPETFGAWELDEQKGIEGIIAYLAAEEENDFTIKIKQVFESIKQDPELDSLFVPTLRRHLSRLGNCYFLKQAQAPNSIRNARPSELSTATYRASEDGKLLFVQFFRHENKT